MIYNIADSCRLIELDTETKKISNTRQLGYSYLRDKYFIEHGGKFVFPERYKLDPIDVEDGDLVLVLYGPKPGAFTHIKTNIKEIIPLLDQIDAAQKEQEEAKSESACVGDCDECEKCATF